MRDISLNFLLITLIYIYDLSCLLQFNNLSYLILQLKFLKLDRLNTLFFLK